MEMKTKTEWFLEWLLKQDFEKDRNDIHAELRRRKENPDWERPMVMYCVRKSGHKFIKKKEIAVVIDQMPWQQRARTAETHWYHVVYKRPATDVEWKENRINNTVRRYTVWPYFIQNRGTVDKIISHIIQDDLENYHIEPGIISDIISAFEEFYKRKIRIFRIEYPQQLSISFNE